MPAKSKLNALQKSLLDPSLDPERRARMFMRLIEHAPDDAEAVLHALMRNGGGDEAAAVVESKAADLQKRLEELHAGPTRVATYLQPVHRAGESQARGLCTLGDGLLLCPHIPDDALAQNLKEGQEVLLAADGATLLGTVPARQINTGEVGTLAAITNGRVEVTLHHDVRAALAVAPALQAKLDAGQASIGARVVINLRQGFALDTLAENNGEDALAAFRFLDRSPPPSVCIADLGAPHPVIEEVLTHVRRELWNPEIGRKYGLSRTLCKLFAGAPGGGKSHSLSAIIHAAYDLCAQFTGAPVAALPPLVLRLNASTVLSKWLGESEKQIDLFFSEALRLASRPFTYNGRTFRLFAIVIMEEIDALTHQPPGGDLSENAMPRIQASLLNRFDPARAEFRDNLMLILGTTNHASCLIPGMVRRLGEDIEHFGRLTQRGAFKAVLAKHLASLPLASNNGASQDELRRIAVERITAWLFAVNDNPAMAELMFAGQATAFKPQRKDFITHALVQRAVRRAAQEAARREETQPLHCGGGVTVAALAAAIDRQVNDLVRLLSPGNAREYLDLPDGAHVASVRRTLTPAPFDASEFASPTTTQTEKHHDHLHPHVVL